MSGHLSIDEENGDWILSLDNLADLHPAAIVQFGYSPSGHFWLRLIESSAPDGLTDYLRFGPGGASGCKVIGDETTIHALHALVEPLVADPERFLAAIDAALRAGWDLDD